MGSKKGVKSMTIYAIWLLNRLLKDQQYGIMDENQNALANEKITLLK